LNTPPVVSPEEWQAARDQMLAREKELTHARDALAAERRRMPWMAVEKDYSFDGPDGRVSLLDLFEGRRQLIVYRFFYEDDVEGFPEHGCPGCARVRVARASGEHPAVEGADGLGNALVHRHGRFRY
jgi:predicted dithiol-disulfide oxidoreductase (DUF899 family)